MTTTAKPTERLTLTAAERKIIVEEYDSYPRGDARRGALLRRYGLYTSQMSKWRDRGRGRLHQEHDVPRDAVNPARPRLRLTGAPMSAQGVRLTTAIVGVGNIRGALARRLVAGGASGVVTAKNQCSRIAAR